MQLCDGFAHQELSASNPCQKKSGKAKDAGSNSMIAREKKCSQGLEEALKTPTSFQKPLLTKAGPC